MESIEFEPRFEQQEKEKKKKKKVKYEPLIIEKTDENYIESLRKKHIFQTQGKAIMTVKDEKGVNRQMFEDKNQALEEAILEKMKNQLAKVKLLVEI